MKFDSEPRVTAEGTKLKTSDSHNGDMISNIVTRVEPRFNEIPKHWGNWFVILSVRYIEILDLTNLQGNN